MIILNSSFINLNNGWLHGTTKNNTSCLNVIFGVKIIYLIIQCDMYYHSLVSGCFPDQYPVKYYPVKQYLVQSR